MKILNDELVYEGKFIKVFKRNFLGRGGKKGVWEMVKRKVHGRIVTIVALTPEKEVLLEKIYRVPLRSYVLEFPAGLMDKPGELEVAAIKRELLEETGYAVDSVEFLLSGPFNSGLVEDELAVFLGLNARLVKKQKLESSEDITVIKVPVKDLYDYLVGVKDVKVDTKLFAVLPFLQRRGLL